MAVSGEWLVELARDFHFHDTWARRQAEVLLEGVPPNMQIPLLLSVVLDPEEVDEDRKNAAKHLTHLLPRDFLEFIDSITQEARQEFIKHFLRSVEVNFKSNDVYEELPCCFADIVVQLMDCKEHPKDLLDLMFSDLWSYFTRDEDDFHVIGWSILARMPKAIDNKALKLLKRDLCCEEDSVAFATADCLMSYICDRDSSDELRSEVNELLPSLLAAMERILACPRLRLGFLELLCLCCNYRHRAIWFSHEDKIVDMLLPYVLKTDRQEEEVSLSVLILSALNCCYLSDRITNNLLRLVHQELLEFCHNGDASSSSIWDNLLSTLMSSCGGSEQVAQTSKYLENLLPSSPKDDLEATAPILLAAAAGLGTDELVGRLVPVVTDGLKDMDCQVRRAYGCIFNLLVRQQRGSPAPVVELCRTILVDFYNTSILTRLQEKDPVVRSLTYERYQLFFSGVGLHRIGSQQLSQVLPTWLDFLENELRLYVETGRSTPVKNILEALTEAFLIHEEGCKEVRQFCPLLKAIGTMNNVSGRSKLSSQFLQRAEKAGKPVFQPNCARFLSVLGVQCFMAAIRHHVHTLSSTDLHCMIDVLRSLQVPDCRDGLDREELAVATLVQKIWRELVDFCNSKKPEFVGLVLPYAVASVTQNAAFTLPVEEVEDVPGMRKIMQSRSLFLFTGNRRLLCVDVQGLKLKLSAIEELEKYCGEVQLPHGLLLDITVVVTDLVVIHFGKGLEQMNHTDPTLGSSSDMAARSLPKILLAARATADTRLVLKTWRIVEAGLMKLLWDPRGASCSSPMHSCLAKCSEYAPENETKALLRRITSIVNRTLDQFYTGIQSTKKNIDKENELRGMTTLLFGLQDLIIFVIKKMDIRDGQALFDALAPHCEKLLAPDAPRPNHCFGLSILYYWLHADAFLAKRLMPWLLNRLASHVKRLHSILEGMEPGKYVGSSVHPDEQELQLSAGCFTSLLTTYTAAEPFALKEAIDQLVDQDQDEAGNMDVENFALWRNALILRLVQQVTHSIHPNVLSGIVKTALKFPTASDAGKDYADALADIYTANHPAILPNMGIVVTIARKACESMGDSLRGATKESFRRIVERADEVPDLELPPNDGETDELTSHQQSED